MTEHVGRSKARSVRRVVAAVYAGCAVLLLLDLFYEKEPHFSFESWFGFYAVFGFAVSFLLVLAAKQMRRVVGRTEDYFGDHGEPGGRGADDG